MTVVQMLFEYKADLNWIDSLGQNPLFYACLSKNLPIITFLLEHGASIVNNSKGIPPKIPKSARYLVKQEVKAPEKKEIRQDIKKRTYYVISNKKILKPLVFI